MHRKKDQDIDNEGKKARSTISIKRISYFYTH